MKNKQQKEEKKRTTNIKYKNEKTKKNKPKKTWKKVLLSILLILIVFIALFTYRTYKNGGGVSGMLATVVGHDEYTKKNLKELNLLLLGVSTDQLGVDLTDTIMVASYNPNTQKATLLSIPRDTFVGKNSNKPTGSDKINALYNITKNPESTLEAVNKLTGLEINNYVVVRTEALIELVDAIGGVRFSVPINMEYDDPTQDLHINLQEGEQLIDGEKAEQLLRFRHNNDGSTYPIEYGDNDTGRMRTQREFITETLKQTLKPENIFKIGQILEIASKNLTTNLEWSYLKDYIPYAVEFNTENMVTGTIPGENTNKNSTEIWIFLPNKKETEKLIQELFYDRDNAEGEDAETTNTTDVNNTTNKTNTTNTNNSKIEKKNSDIKIEVLNGTGDSKKLQEAIDVLKNAGFNVTKYGNTSTISKTIITNKKEAEDSKVKEIKNTLGVGSISNNKTLSSKVDITIVIGKDFDSNK